METQSPVTIEALTNSNRYPVRWQVTLPSGDEPHSESIQPICDYVLKYLPKIVGSTSA